MANMVQYPFRATPEELEDIRNRAHERGLSVNAYMRRQMQLDRDERDQAVRESITRTYARLADSTEFDALDERLAALPRPSSAELGFDPQAVSDETAAA